MSPFASAPPPQASLPPQASGDIRTFMLRALLVLSALALAPEAPTAPLPAAPLAPLRVEVTGLESSRGSVRIAVFSSEETFLDDAAFAAIRPIARGRSVWRVAVPPGTYAAAAHHDRDGDGEMARGLFGIPSEPHGFSRGARGRFGPPSWRDARVRVGASGAVVRVRVR